MEKGGHLVLLLLVCLGLCSGQPESTDSNEIPAPRTTADPRCMVSRTPRVAGTDIGTQQ